MTETINLNANKNPTVLNSEALTPQQPERVKIQGVLTSNIYSRKSSDTPYYAFLRLDNSKHSLLECQQTKCQDCDIPIIFRWVSKPHCYHEMKPKEECFNKQEHWQKPNLKKGARVLLQGNWATSDHSSRPSFTAYSYQQLANKCIKKDCFGCGDKFTCSAQENYDYCTNCAINGNRYINQASNCSECDGSGYIKFTNQPLRKCKLCCLKREGNILHHE